MKTVMQALYGLSLLISSFAFANCDSESCFPNNQLWIAPEFYHLNRHRHGGTKQDGYLYGGRAAYERIKGRKYYLGVEGLIATGRLHGHSGNDQKLVSCLTDKFIEGRLGYTFQLDRFCFPILLTPYVGYGYFWETNKYEKPKDLKIHFCNRFSYVPVGFLLQACFKEQWSIGLNFKCRILVDGDVKSKHDPEFQNTTQQYKLKPQYRLEIPLSYYFYCFCRPFRLTLEPFYEFRHYGFHPNYPFDFLDTKFNIWGANIQIGYFF